MSRNFEDEYREMMLSDIPDLWDRIEKKLPEKKVTPVCDIRENEKKKIWMLRPGTVKYLAGIAACVVLVCVAVPAMQIAKSSSTSQSSEEAVMETKNIQSDGAVDNTVNSDTSVTKSTTDTGVTGKSTITNDGGATADTAAALPATDLPTEISDFQSAESESGLVSAEEDSDGDSTANESAIDAEKSPETAKSSDLDRIDQSTPEDRFSYKATGVAPVIPAVTYTELPISITGSKKSGTETIFTAVVSKENSCGLDMNTELLVKITDTSVGELKSGKDYVVTLISDDTESTSSTKQVYIVEKISK